MNSFATFVLLRNARLVLSDRTIEAANLLIKDGRIARIYGPAENPSSAETSIDLDGLTVFPGFIDAHIHGANGVDTMDATADDLRRVGEFLSSKGVTAWMPTLVPAPREQYEQAVRAIGEAVAKTSATETDYRLQSGISASRKSPTEVGTLNTRSARVLGVHYEGPFVNSEQCGALHKEHFRTFTKPEQLDTLPRITNASLDKDQHAGGVRTQAVHLMTLAPEVEGGIELIKELKKRSWIVAIGHTRATSDVLDQALSAGGRHMTHFMNAMTLLHHRSVGAVGWGLIHDDVTCDVIADGIHIDREILKLIVRTKSADRVSLISDAIAAAGKGDGDYDIWGEKISVKNGRTQNARGSIAGSVITVLDAVRTMMTLGFSECEVARMASLNPARLLGIDRECGSIEAGKRADLVAIDENQNVRLTLIGGQIAFQS